MSQIPNKIDGLGRREATTVATGTAQRIFAASGSGDPSRRKAVSVNNVDAAAELYVSLAASGASAPAVSTTDHDVLVPPRSSRQFQVGPGIDLWVRASGAGAVAYTALELL